MLATVFYSHREVKTPIATLLMQWRASEFLARDEVQTMGTWYREIKERCVLYVEYGLMTASASGLLYVFYAMSR
jgi:hypothetical protein